MTKKTDKQKIEELKLDLKLQTQIIRNLGKTLIVIGKNLTDPKVRSKELALAYGKLMLKEGKWIAKY